MTDLRGYQINAIAEIDAAIAAGKKRVLLVAPTGEDRYVCRAC